ncbi:MAG: acnA, partial [Moraxellaceae bacterium]|nr:acnA [Moraxellaceae bacterium]
EGGYTLLDGEMTTVYEAAMEYRARGVPTIIIAGEEYGTGSSRDWAAKGTLLLGVKAVIAKSFERIHRSNLVGMGVLPLQFVEGDSFQSLGLTGDETFDICGITADLMPKQPLLLKIRKPGEEERDIAVIARIDTPIEVDYYRHGGILPYVLRQILAAS